MDNHERTINFAFFFVQNNLGGKLSGYWKWQIHQSTPKPCWLIRCGRSCVFITTRSAPKKPISSGCAAFWFFIADPPLAPPRRGTGRAAFARDAEAGLGGQESAGSSGLRVE